MCYYSTALRASQVRAAREGEDLVMTSDGAGHHLPVASDGKVVCMLHGSEMHIEKLMHADHVPNGVRYALCSLIGKPVSARLTTRVHGSYAVDRIRIEDKGQVHEVHFLYLAAGTKFYIGPKRPDMAEKLGVNDRSIMLDHDPNPKPEDEEKEEAPVQEPAPEKPAPVEAA